MYKQTIISFAKCFWGLLEKYVLRSLFLQHLQVGSNILLHLNIVERGSTLVARQHLSTQFFSHQTVVRPYIFGRRTIW